MTSFFSRKINLVKRLYSSCYFPDIDVEYYCNRNNISEIKCNIEMRKGVGDINRVHDLYKKLKETSVDDSNYVSLKDNFYKELTSIPNKTHPTVQQYNDHPRTISTINTRKDFGSHKPLDFSEITQLLNLMRTDKLGYTCDNKSYFYFGDLAEYEEALIKYTVSCLLEKGFSLVSVPDILSGDIIRSCGMMINRDRTQIYSLDPSLHGPDQYLSGTAEMSLAGLLNNSIHNVKELPLKLVSVSRCYRAETSNIIEERGTYRVHQFTKVEMFIASKPEESDAMLEYIRQTQEELFSPLGLHMRVLDMPPHELGAPAYRKYDIEAWMPGRQNYGEISSCSNCTDYQSRRLNIKYCDVNKTTYVHTLNGTGCAIPRMLIALFETHQLAKGKIFVPEILQPFLSGKKYIGKNVTVPKLKLLKVKNYTVFYYAITLSCIRRSKFKNMEVKATKCRLNPYNMTFA